ncbi:hypothetical protein ACFFSY_34075 [Paenibacillus aurantiacus]|uniref:Uncharacterized protein n=1 Tax=Paenibacillus aurantiacus TaxID=1936118 RepID=A0ABV5L0J4_9BACL
MLKDRFCCVSCGEMIQHEQAHLVFRTGFFRTIQPLGCCKVCMDRESVAATAAVEAPVEGSLVHMPQAKAGGAYNESIPAASYAVPIPMVASL